MRAIFGFLLLVVSSAAKGPSAHLIAQSVATYKTSLSEAAVEVVQKFYTQHQAHIYILSKTFSKDRYSVLNLVNEILFRVRGMITYMHWNTTVTKVIYRRPSSYNMIVVDNYRAFQKIYAILNRRSFNFDGYFLVVISSELKDNLESTLERIFLDCYNMYITNVNVLIKRSVPGYDAVDMYTYFLFTEAACRSMRPVLYNTFTNGTFTKDADIFPSKTKDFHGCPVTVVTWNYPPHMFLRDLGGGKMEYYGIDGNILRILVEKMNFSLKFDLTATYRGNVFWNGSGNGALGVILSGRGNITICAHGFMFTSKSRLSASVNYFSTAIVFAIPAFKFYNSFEKLFFVYSATVWFLTVGSHVAAFIFLHVVRRVNKKLLDFIVGKEIHGPFCNMFSITTGSPVPKVPKRNFARFLLMLWTLSTLVLRGSYQGSLFDYLQKNEEQRNSLTLVSLLKRGYTLHVPEDCLQWFKFHNEVNGHINRIVVMNRSLWAYFDDMQDPDYRGIVLTTDIQIDYYNHRKGNGAHVKMLDERLFYTPQSIFYPIYSFLVHPIDLILNDCLSGGLVNHWVKTFLHKSTEHSTTMHKPIFYGNLKGFLSLIFSLQCFSVLVFFTEILVWKVKVKMNLIKSWLRRRRFAL